MNRSTEKLLKKNSMNIILFLVVLIFSGLTGGSILQPQNVSNLISQNAYVIILSIGMLLCVLTGGNVDLSVGSVVALVGALAGKMIVTYNMNIFLTIAVCILVGLIIGAIHGFIIAYLNVPAFIATLAGMMVWRGVSLVILQGMTIAPFPETYSGMFNNYLVDFFNGSHINILCAAIGAVLSVIFLITSLRSRKIAKERNIATSSNAEFWTTRVIIIAVIMYVAIQLAQYRGFPLILIFLGIIAVIYHYYLSKTVNGRYFYAVGGNEKAAAMSGIDTRKVYFKAYMNMGLLSALAGLVVVARFNSAPPTMGTGYEMDAIASVYIGGASAYGGIGAVPGVIVGALFMGVLNNGMSIMGIDADWQRIVKGIVLAAAVIFDIMSKNKPSSSK